MKTIEKLGTTDKLNSIFYHETLFYHLCKPICLNLEPFTSYILRLRFFHIPVEIENNLGYLIDY